ncbi:hypothetical protein [Brevundimonas sp. DC300-4]|uniref:hypothetical protein n=1 Tax=Brevundimonas sp. DC300-4 TaxID=2804594 RepID=UPI003CF26C25
MIVALIVGSIIIVKIEDGLDRDREHLLRRSAATLAGTETCEREAQAPARRLDSSDADRRHACLIPLPDSDAAQGSSPDQAAP